MANVNKLLIEVEIAIQDFFNTKFELNFTTARDVPTYEDYDLTFERGNLKRGKEIETCVLFVDIRDSVLLNNTHQKDTMAKLYAAFVKSIIYAANFHNGAVRNIIGDRVMVVFQPQNCFVDAVECSISINKICNSILNKHFKLNTIKCGIGIDYGHMRVIKVGTHKKGAERASSKNLIWVGHPANVASRLTDIANKKVINKNVTYKIEKYQFLGLYRMAFPKGPMSSYGLPQNKHGNFPKKIRVDDTIKADEFISRLIMNESGELFVKSVSGISQDRLISFEHKKEELNNPPILMTETVYLNYKMQKPESNDIKGGMWQRKILEVKDYKGNILGGDVTWKI